ncbi:g8977 [Coccomyxa elongata]
MALRQLASSAARCTGLSWASPLSGQTSISLATAFRVAGVRAFATVEEGLKYAKSHEWAKIEGDTATIGISDFAQSELGDIVYVELPEVGSEVTKGENFGVVESVKAASDVYSPLSGEVVDTNQALSEDPSQVNTAPFHDGWMIKVKLTNPSEADSLLDSTAYGKQCEDSAH